MLTDAEFALIAREVKARTGAALTPDTAGAIEQKLTPLMRRSSFTLVSDLIASARSNHTVWDQIADILLNGETRFFRDRALFKALRGELLSELAARKGGRLTIWSAGCASGQEAISLAIIAEELRNQGRGGADIVATDCSERLLEKARSGLYTQFEVQRGLPIRTLIGNFEKLSELWRVHDRVRALVRYEKHNLLQDAGALGTFDLVLCCNVLNGMTAPAQQAALENIAGALAPNGILAISAGETLEASGGAFDALGAGLFQRNAAWRKAA